MKDRAEYLISGITEVTNTEPWNGVHCTRLAEKARPTTRREDILEAARKCVCGDREQDYGSPEDNFNRIAKMWSAYFGIEVTAKDVAACQGLVKIARIASGNAKEDNWVDLAGYAACGGEIEANGR